ncbi:secretagogin-like [Anneissia japonica]|uniref:secretagogin-like n=1 Tax=Anneissia japonica TaxID=1529436 RepID=UPI001425A21C|nr:secretagogin-like [Anneissia japonica]
MSRKYDNFLAQYPASGKLTAYSFAKIWEHYDSNNSGYIDEDGLDLFFKDLLCTMTDDRHVTDEMVSDMKSCFMEAYDDAGDGKIAISELANILRTDENFLLLFHREEQLVSSVELMKVWQKYDTDGTKYISSSQLESFIQDLLKLHGKTDIPKSKLIEYTKGMLTIFDKNDDGQLSLAEMARLLSIKPQDNIILQAEKSFKHLSMREKKAEFNRIFDYYDKSKTKAIEGEELDAFVKDLLEKNQADTSPMQIDLFKRCILQNCDKNGDGKIQKGELETCLGIYADVN